MYRWLRNTHLFLGLFTCLFVLMYGVSSVKLSHRTWFAGPGPGTESRISIPAEAATSARAVARELMDKHGMSGEVAGGRVTPEGYRFRIVRPGTRYEVEYVKASGEASVNTRTADFMTTMVGIHEQGGLGHESWLKNAWGAFVVVTSIGLIVLALTGIYLWFKIHSERVVGVVLLGISLGYSLTIMFILRAA